jgi:lysylphosphatidylglycerol synthetase-like protein (DUF2156 family)
MIVTQEGDIMEYHPAIRWAAKLVSIIFHPLFIPIYVGWFLIFEKRLFSQLDDWNRLKLLLSLLVNYTVLPLASMLLAKGLGFIDSLYLRTQKDRIIPFIVTGVFYFWIWYVLKNQNTAKELIMFALAIFLSSSAGLIANSYLKVSLHGIACGVVVMFMLLFGLRSRLELGLYISAAVFICGLVCTARLINGDHQPKEVYVGLAIGAVAQLVASFFV